MGFFKFILKIIAIVLIIIAIVYLVLALIAAVAGGISMGGFAWISLGITTANWGVFAALSFGAFAIASILSPDTVSKAVKRVGQGLSSVAENVVDVTGDALESAIERFVLSPYALAGGLGLLWWFTRDTSASRANNIKPGSEQLQYGNGDTPYVQNTRLSAGRNSYT
jgi:hypothetical protein